MASRLRPSRWIAIAAVALLAVGVGILSAVAFQRVNTTTEGGTAAPVPSFTLGVDPSTPAPTPTSVPTAEPAPPRETERFLSIGSQAMWRATAGGCGAAEPRVERSGDGGETWSDVTPRYLGLGQVASISAFSAQDTEIVAGVGEGCETQLLRTFTDGEFWESYPEVLAGYRYLDLADSSLVHLGRAATADAPCTQARSLRAERDVITLVCDQRAWVWNGSEWSRLSATRVVAVAVDDGAVLAAHTADGCAGVMVTRFAASASADDPGAPIACAEGLNPDSPVAIEDAGDSVLVWSGDSFVRVDG